MRIKSLLILLVSLAAVIFSAPLDKKFEEGNKYFQDGNYVRAASIYENIVDQGYESTELYYNLGNAYYRIDKLGYAILNYEKALKLSPGDEDTEYNLELAKARTVDKIKEVPKLFLLEWSDSMLASLSVQGWAIVVAVVYVALILLVGLFLLGKSPAKQRFAFFSGTVTLVVLIAVSIILFASYNRETTSDYGVVVIETVAVKLSPDIKSNDAFVIHEGLKFTLEDELSDWYKIKLGDGKVGWINKSAFEKI